MSQQTVGKLAFKSKKALRDYTKDFLLQNKNKRLEIGSTEYTFLLELLQRHPECLQKMGTGISYFYCKDGFGTDTTYLTIHRTDGTSDAVSWVTCCEARGQSPNTTLNALLRQAISPDVIEYFQARVKKYCAECLDTGKLEVDHVHPFKDIRERFIERVFSLRPVKIEEVLQYSVIQKKFIEEFVQYHKTVAAYQLLCIPCHHKKSNPTKETP